MFYNGFGGMGGIDGFGGLNGSGGVDPMAGLLWQLFEESGQTGYYMLLKELGVADASEEETDHRRD